MPRVRECLSPPQDHFSLVDHGGVHKAVLSESRLCSGAVFPLSETEHSDKQYWGPFN